MTTCPVCHVTVGPSEQFCEACGAQLSPTVATEPPLADEPALAVPMPSDLAGTAVHLPGLRR